MVELVVFDMAGTTVDERDVVYRTLHAVLRDAGHDGVTLADVHRHGAGKEKRTAMADILAALGRSAGGPRADDAHLDALFHAFGDRLDRAYAVLDLRPMPDAARVFDALRAAGVRVVLNTGYSRRVATGLLARLGWILGRDVDALITAEDVGASRPAPAMIHAAMAAFGVRDPARVVKVGDTEADLREGWNARCGLCVGVTTGALGRAALEALGADAVLDRLAGLLPLVGVSPGLETRLPTAALAR